MRVEIITENQKNYTGYCDKNGNKIFIDNILEFYDSDGAIWQGRVVIDDGLITICDYKDIKQIKNPPNWKRKHNWIRSRNWSSLVGYPEFGSWNCPRRSLIMIAGIFKDYKQFNKARLKFDKKNNSELLFRPLPVRIIRGKNK